MADFNFRLNQQGPQGKQGPQGEKGEDGITPIFYEGTNTPTEYTLTIDYGNGNTSSTGNLRPPVTNNGGTYLRYENGYVLGTPDYADLNRNPGEVILASVADVANEDAEDSDAVSIELRNSDLTAINNRFDAVEGDVTTLQTNKADKSTTYTKTEVDQLIQTGGQFTTGDGVDLTNGILSAKVDGTTINFDNSGNLTVIGGGGGGTSYSAGTGIDITNNTISVDNATLNTINNAVQPNDLGYLATKDTVNYNTDVTNKPTLGSLASKNTVDYTTDITNKPTLGSLSGKDTVDYVTEVTNKPTIGAGIITFTQGSTTLGTIDVNQTTATTINIPSSGGGGGGGTTYASGNGIEISATDIISAKVDNSTIGFTAGGELELKATIPTDTSDLTNNAGYITSSALSGYATETWVGNQGYLTGITSGDVTTALGYTPYSSANPDGYTSNVGTVTSVNNTNPDSNGNVTLSIPDVTNMVTTNTYQTISGTKDFSQIGFTIAVDANNRTALDLSGGVYKLGNAFNTLSFEGSGTRPLYNGTDYLALSSDIPTVNDSTISFTVNGISAGSITTNQASGSTIALTDTQYSVMTGASAGSAGASGLVPAPTAGDNEKYLRGDGTWQTVSSGNNYSAGDGIDITSNTISAKVDNDTMTINSSGQLVANMEDVSDALEAIIGTSATFPDYYSKTQSDNKYVYILDKQFVGSSGSGTGPDNWIVQYVLYSDGTFIQCGRSQFPINWTATVNYLCNLYYPIEADGANGYCPAYSCDTIRDITWAGTANAYNDSTIVLGCEEGANDIIGANPITHFRVLPALVINDGKHTANNYCTYIVRGQVPNTVLEAFND